MMDGKETADLLRSLKAAYADVYNESMVNPGGPPKPSGSISNPGGPSKTNLGAMVNKVSGNKGGKPVSGGAASSMSGLKNSYEPDGEMLEGYKTFPKHKVQDKAAMKPDTAKGEKQARKMDKVRAVMSDNDTGLGNAARQFNKRQPEANRKRRLEKNFKAPSHDKGLQAKKDKLEKAFKKEELDYVLNYIIDEGYTTDEQSAIHFLNHMSPDWIEEIISE